MIAASTFFGLGASEWEALGTWATVAVAIVAAWLALRQIRASREAMMQAKRATVEATWPYIAVFMEPTEASANFVDLVIHNFGQTAATEVRVTSDVAIQRSPHVGRTDSEDVWIPGVIPTLAPGQEWRTLWDFGPERFKTDLPSRHTINVTYHSSDETSHDHRYVLDWEAYRGRYYATVKTVHDAAKSLVEIEKTMRKWNESVAGSLSVYVRDGHARDQQIEREYAEIQQRRSGLDAQE